MATQNDTVGSFVWRELQSTDVSKSVRFYSELFGWNITEMDMGTMGKYQVIQANGNPVGGIRAFAKPGVPSHWVGYISVNNVDEAAKTAQTAGGTIALGPTELPGQGRFAVLLDPQGAPTIAFRSLGQGHGRATPKLGEFC